MDRALASSINSAPHLSVFYDIVSDRIDDLTLTDILTNLIDTAPSGALLNLANQFNIAGIRGFMYMPTVQQQRELLKSALQLSAKSGTPYAIKKVLEIFGFPGVTFQEGVSKVLDGTWVLDGTETLGSEGWAEFIAIVPVPESWGTVGGTVSAKDQAIVEAIINEYKPARCHLVGVQYIY